MADPPLNRAYLSLGSNIDAERNLPAAAERLGRYGAIIAVSNIWETPPVGYLDQSPFLNAAVLLETPLTAEHVLSRVIPEIEAELHRLRDPLNRNAPRTIDVDLSLFNDFAGEVCGRRLPDPDVLTRAFVAVPLAELDPDHVHPVTGRSLADIAAGFDDHPDTMRLRRDVVLPAVPGDDALTADSGQGPGVSGFHSA